MFLASSRCTLDKLVGGKVEIGKKSSVCWTVAKLSFNFNFNFNYSWKLSLHYSHLIHPATQPPTHPPGKVVKLNIKDKWNKLLILTLTKNNDDFNFDDFNFADFNFDDFNFDDFNFDD